jgi:predicted amidohydrolase YtcJ
MMSAYAEVAEHDKESLESGKFANLALLSQDIFTVTIERVVPSRTEEQCTRTPSGCVRGNRKSV